MKFWQVLSEIFGADNANKAKNNQNYNENIAFLNTKVSIHKPVSFKDIVKFVEIMRENMPLIVNFKYLKTEEAERCLDFVCGAVCALHGSLENIGEGIYFYAPKSVKVENYKRIKGKNYAN